MKNLLLTAALVAGLAGPSRAQTTPSAMPNQAGTFRGAIADQPHYNAIYQLDSSDPKLIKQTLGNIRNVLADSRLQGKISVELVAFADGVALFRKDQPYESQLLDLKAKGVILAQCLNTLRERQISPDELLPFISLVPSGNGELVIRQAQGWALVHP